MIDRTGFWNFIQPYARSTHEILCRLTVARGLAATIAMGGSVTTNFTDHEFACLQVLIATEKLAASIAALHGVADRELVFAGDIPGWQLNPLAILPMPVDVEGQSYRLRRSDYIRPEEFLRLRNEAREALQLESLKSPDDAIPVDAIGGAADKLHAWLRSQMLIIPQFDGIAILAQADDGAKCYLLPIDDFEPSYE